MKALTAQELVTATATPAAVGRHIGKDFLGRPYKVYPWVRYMEQQILSMLLRPGPEIMIVSVPPQQGKSTYCSFLLPLWYLGRNPGNQVINISYNDQQAQKWGLRVRNAMQRYGQELFGVSIASDSDSKGAWVMGNGFGGMMSVGITAGITGNPGHLMILDDTLKGSEDANSTVIKKRNLGEWDDSITTRFQEDTKVLVVATRFAEDDLSGEIKARSLAPGYDGFPVSEMNLKALAEPDPDDIKGMTAEQLAEWRDVLGRKYGEGLKGQHSQRFFEIKRNSTPHGRWMAIHQGTPTASVGGMFPEIHWRYYYDPKWGSQAEGDSQLPALTQRVRVWDIAASEGDGDWTVGSLWGKDSDNNTYLLDVERFRHGPGIVESKIIHTATIDGSEVPILIEEERNGAGKTVISHYVNHKELAGYRVEGVKAEGSKESRATTYSILQNKEKVFLPRNAPYVNLWVKEHNQLDGKGGKPKNDDQIDTGAYAHRFLIGSGDSILWDMSQMSLDDMSPEDRLEYYAAAQALGFAVG